MTDEHTSDPAPKSESFVNPDAPHSGNHVWQAIKSSKLLKIGLPLLLVALLPVVVLLAREQQTNQSRASKATVLSFAPASTVSAPIQVTEGEYITVNIMLDPGTNLVSFVRLAIEYDTNYLALENHSDFQVNKDAFPSPLQTTYSQGRIDDTLTIGADPAKAIQTPTQVGTVKFRALRPTPEDATLIRFGTTTTVLSIGAEDKFNENVLSGTTPAVIKIINNPNPVPTITVAASPSASVTPKLVACVASRADVTKDGKLNYLDISTATSCTTTPSLVSCQSVDVNEDGNINSADVKCISDAICSPEVADVNNDGKVAADDYQAISSCFNKNAEGACTAYDINGSGRVDLEDLNCIQRQIPTPTPSATP